jgi:hypothetical protein
MVGSKFSNGPHHLQSQIHLIINPNTIVNITHIEGVNNLTSYNSL